MPKVAENPPLFFHLMDSDALTCRIGLYTPVFRVVLNIDKILIVRIDKVELDPKKFQLIEGSQKEIPFDSFYI